MSYGIELTREDGVLLTFDGHYNNFRVAEVKEHEELAYPRDGGNPSASSFKSRVSVTHSVTGPSIIFRRFISFRSEQVNGGSAGMYTVWYVNYKYIICELSTTPATGYGLAIWDNDNNIAFNSNDSYILAYSIGNRNRYASFTIPTPPSGTYSYVSVAGSGQFLYVTQGEGPQGTVYSLYKQTVDISASNCLLHDIPTRQSQNNSFNSKSPVLYGSKSEADAATSYYESTSVIPILFIAYNE
jgi:hypothetical protein